jgi:hypothetical protein
MMNKLQLETINTKVSKAVLAFDDKFREDHADMLDFGTCGFAVVLLSFGRKRKIKNECLEAGFISEDSTWEDSYGHKSFSVELPKQTVPTQNMGYYEGRASAAVQVLCAELEGTGIQINIHRWVD